MSDRLGNNLIDRIHRAMLVDDDDWDHQSTLLQALYRKSSEAERIIIDDVFICLCGWRLITLIKEQET
jgi:hypothetical protein